MARLTLLTPASPEWRQLRPTRTSGNMMHLHWQRTRRMGARDPPQMQRWDLIQTTSISAKVRGH